MLAIRNESRVLADPLGEAERCRNDIVYWLETYCYTYDPRKEQPDIPFVLYPYQREYLLDLLDRIDNGRDVFTEKSRDMGITWLVLSAFAHRFIFKAGYQFKIGSRKEDDVDNWQMDTLFPKLEYLIVNQPFLPDGFKPKEHRLYMKLENPENGNTIIGESANRDFSRSGRYNAIFFDEMAFWPWQESSWGAAGDATPCRIAVTTPSEQPSFAKGLRNSGLIDVKTLHWQLHPEKGREWYEAQKARRTQDEIARELDINWEGSTKGIVYPEIAQAQLGDFPLILGTGLFVSWDFGLDGTAIQWWQRDPANGRARLLDSYFQTDRVIEYFLPLFGKPTDSQHPYSLEDVEFFKIIGQWPKATHFGDVDVAKRSIQTGETTAQVLSKHGIHVWTNPLRNNLESRKTATKLMLQQGIQVNDTPRNRFWLECMRNARYPQRQDTSQAVTPNITPIHDWTSHHRTATEYFCVNESVPKPLPETTYEKVTSDEDLGYSTKFQKVRRRRSSPGGVSIFDL